MHYPDLWAKQHSHIQSDNNSQTNQEYDIDITHDDNTEFASTQNDRNKSGATQSVYDITSNSIITNTSTNTITNSINTEPDAKLDADQVVFKIIKTNMPDIYNLYSVEKSQNIKHSIALIPTLNISRYLNTLFDSNPSKLDHQIICRYSANFNRWVPITTTSNKAYSVKQVAEIETRLKASAPDNAGSNNL
jgi:hypothetical protein